MAVMASIRQNVHPNALPDFRNLGVIARIVIGTHLLALGAAVYAEPGWTQVLERFMRAAAMLEPTLLATLIALYAASPRLMRLPYWRGCGVALFTVLVFTALMHAYFSPRGIGFAPGDLQRELALAVFVAVLLLGYFRLMVRAYSPALSEVDQ